MAKLWSQQGDIFRHFPKVQQQDSLRPGIYRLDLDQFGLHLNRQMDKFSFGYKVYGKDDVFIERVIDTFIAMPDNKNLGVLLNGLKGTGKTVTAKQICNKCNLPVILVNRPYDGYREFINDIQEDVVVLFDEFEKTFDGESHTMLTLLDGTLHTKCKKLFLFTTNSTSIDTNLLHRPSRIRYTRTFGNLDSETIDLLINDLLIHDHLKGQTKSYIMSLEIITIDTIKEIIAEVNMYEESPYEFHDFFNVNFSYNSNYHINLSVVKQVNETDVKFIKDINLLEVYDELVKSNIDYYFAASISENNPKALNYDFRIEDANLGSVSAIISENAFIIQPLDKKSRESIINEYYVDYCDDSKIKPNFDLSYDDMLDEMLKNDSTYAVFTILKNIKLLNSLKDDETIMVEFDRYINTKKDKKLVY